jgi:hypothetical protein
MTPRSRMPRPNQEILSVDSIRLFAQNEQAEIIGRVGDGMRRALPEQKAAGRQLIVSKLKVQRETFANVFTGLVSQPDGKAPVTIFYSKAGWLEAHAEGVTIRGRRGRGVLIPINTKLDRMGYRAFKRRIEQLDSQGNLDFRNINGKVIVFAEVAAMRELGVSGFRRTQVIDGKRKRTAEVPVAVLVRSVRIPKRLDFVGLADRLATLARRSVDSALSA